MTALLTKPCTAAERDLAVTALRVASEKLERISADDVARVPLGAVLALASARVVIWDALRRLGQ